MRYLILLVCLALAPTTQAQENPSLSDSNSTAVDYPTLIGLTNTAYEHRKNRLLSLDEWLEAAADDNTVILDTRSKEAYKKKHVRGAIHLNFSDFTADKLAKLIPDKNTKILIYCNNNFMGDDFAFPRKAPPLALNVPTFINLYGYGYKNIYELNAYVSVENKKLKFSGKKINTKRYKNPTAQGRA